jgi:acetyltransferase-like isoleucine patch superfamily enzyme
MSSIESFQSRSRTAHGRRAVDAVIEHALISKTFQYAYYHVPKCACTTLKNMLWRAEFACEARVMGPTDPSEVHVMQRDPRSPWLSQPGAIAAELSRGDQDRFWFLVVRNPFARIYSAYQWLMVDGNEQTRAENRAKLGWTSEHSPSFSTFVELVSLQHPEDMDHHWAPISSFVPIDDINFDAVAHVENLDAEMPPVFERIFNGRATFDPNLRLFKSSSTEWATLLSSISAATLNLIQRIYVEDFEAFNYSTDPSVLEPLRTYPVKTAVKSKLSEVLRYQGGAWASRSVSGPDTVTTLDIARRFPGLDLGGMRGLVLRNNEMPRWWSQNRCQLWAASGALLPTITPHPGIALPSEAMVVLGGAPNPGHIMIWGEGSTVVVCSGVQLPEATISCGDGSGVFIGPGIISSGGAFIDARNGGSIVVEGDGLWFNGVRLFNDGLHAIRDRATGERLNAYGSDVRIGRRVWLGDGVLIEPGAVIGEGSAVGHRSRVTSEMPPNSWSSGNPATIQRTNIRWGFENAR